MADPTEALSPRQTAPELAGDTGIHSSSRASGSVNNSLDSINLRADPDAQATVTDFLDFTEYLPSDITRSLTLIGKLDQTYIDASTKVHQLTKDWGQLPLRPGEEKPSPVQLRADISENLKHGVSARTYAYAEATRMAENVNQHYKRVKSILTKLQAMKANWPPPEEQHSPVATSKSPQITRAPKPALRGADGHKIRRQQIPRITVPGEVLAPYEINYDDYSDSSDEGAAEEEGRRESPAPLGVTPGPQSRIKVIRKEKPPRTPKAPKTPKPRPTFVPSSALPVGAASAPVPRVTVPHVSTSVALAKLKPPPENAVKGSSDAPWLQLTAYELAKLRKRMKKNAAWSPSDTMISRELKLLGRGWEEFKNAKQQAEDEGREFEGRIPSLLVDPDTGAMVMPMGALSQAAIAIEERNLNNPKKRVSAPRKPKVTQPALSAAEEAEESTRKFQEVARQLMLTPSQPPSLPDLSSQAKAATGAPKSARQRKRKRDSVAETEAEQPESLEAPATRPPAKRTKTQTPVPPPQRAPSHFTQETPIPPPQLTAAGTVLIPRTTPIPPPVPVGQDRPVRGLSAASPVSSINTAVSHTPTAISAAVEARPRTETPVPLPIPVEIKTQTPILPPVRETRKSIAARRLEEQQQQQQLQEEQQGDQQEQQPASAPAAPDSAKPLSRVPSPALPVIAPVAIVEPEASAPAPASSPVPTSAPTGPVTRRPASSRGVVEREPREQRERRPTSRASKAGSQDLEQPSMAAERSRRASTARNTPAPDKEPARPASRRSKRPAPGVISRTNSGGNSAVGRRKAAPKKKSAAAKGKKDKAGQVVPNEAAGANAGVGEGDVEVDDEGNVIDPDETRYCTCNRVSFGVMIQCENAENGNCKQEWFHLECVGLTEVPARTTKWYCPDCRKALNIGGRGEVSARGVRT